MCRAECHLNYISFSNRSFLCLNFLSLSALVKTICVTSTQAACQVFEEMTLYSLQSISVSDYHNDFFGECMLCSRCVIRNWNAAAGAIVWISSQVEVEVNYPDLNFDWMLTFDPPAVRLSRYLSHTLADPHWQSEQIKAKHNTHLEEGRLE